ncbi:M23 family peptidase [Pseudoxanthomonas gei]|uniref:M23 family peptidase n=1 Tax=Pseudoxanthomonas gei TaxID=1383030 RepID=A0ABX0AGC0_9GAMM|nr:M23 family metallopeptidase [Pseudoxanthomonas gei]NDK39210.1 M23 family peptidase [Pseudoxanthomonas gei]
MATPPVPRRRYLRAVKPWLWWPLILMLMYWIAAWSWGQPFMAMPRTTWELARLPPPAALPVPVEGVRAARIADTFGAPRGKDRTHAGVDIFARRGTPVLSATRGIVVSVREGGLGGRQVWVLGPARERHYYAHLQDWQPGLQAGDVVGPGMQLGTVGTTGNARGTPPHLHYGIYGADGAYDPLPLLQAYALQASPR